MTEVHNSCMKGIAATSDFQKCLSDVSLFAKVADGLMMFPVTANNLPPFGRWQVLISDPARQYTIYLISFFESLRILSVQQIIENV